MSPDTASAAIAVGPLGEPLTAASLPSGRTRWVARRKAQVVAAVKAGLVTIDEVCDRYALTIEEFASWQRALERSGLAGLRVTKLQSYRSAYSI